MALEVAFSARGLGIENSVLVVAAFQRSLFRAEDSISSLQSCRMFEAWPNLPHARHDGRFLPQGPSKVPST